MDSSSHQQQEENQDHHHHHHHHNHSQEQQQQENQQQQQDDSQNDQQQQQQPVLVIPHELPPSRMVYVLTTSEGRDKLFKLLQYCLLTTIWTLNQENFLPVSSREYWIRRFTSNLSTIRFGRCLFRLGRWLITVVYLQMSLRYLKLLLRARRKPTGAPRTIMILLAVLMCVRGAASFVRSVIRDFLFLSDTKFTRVLQLSPLASHYAERVQLFLWVVTSLVDFALVEWRLTLPGWVPDLRSLRCNCDASTALSLGESRFQFAPTDLDFGCPHPLVPSFFSATEPKSMPVVCTKCESIAVTSNNNNNSSSQQQHQHQPAPYPSSAVLFVPNMVRRMFEFITIIGKHGNYTEMLLLRLKSLCELVLSFALLRSNWNNSTAFSLTSESNSSVLPKVFLTTTSAGLISSVVSLHRVWLAAK